MRNMLLVMKREYLERVRKKSFLVTTMIVPVLMFLAIWVPVQYASKNSLEKRTVMLVAPTQAMADSVKDQLIDTISHESDDPFASDEDKSTTPKRPQDRYTVRTSTDLSDANKAALREQVIQGAIDGFLWVSPDALQKRKVPYFAKEATNFSEQLSLRSAVRVALTSKELADHGLKESEIKGILKPVSLDAVKVEKGKESSSNGFGIFMASFVMVMLLYMTVLIYGIAVMRSVIEEKGSRIMEVMLASVSPREMMAGKIIGVGAVGLTQIAIWMTMSVVLSSPLVQAAKSMTKGFHIPTLDIVFFVTFFLLGYLLYSALYAAIGAVVNSEQEAQQIQFVVMIPLILAIAFVQVVIQHPSSPIAVWLSMVPFCAPMLMFVRIVIETPPWWQIASCIGLMVATIWGLLLLCARIYRVGILMYGKRPTLPELVKWLKYAN